MGLILDHNENNISSDGGNTQIDGKDPFAVATSGSAGIAQFNTDTFIVSAGVVSAIIDTPFVLKNITTTSNTPKIVDMIIPFDTTTLYTVTVMAKQYDGSVGTPGDSFGVRIDGIIERNDSDEISLKGIPAETIIFRDDGATSWDVYIDVDDTSKSLIVTLVGENNKAINWGIKIESVNSITGETFIEIIGEGYFGGGWTTGWTTTNSIEKLVFGNETISTLLGTLSQGSVYFDGLNSSEKGYFGATGVNNYTSTIESVQFNDKSVSVETATLNVARNGLAGVNSTSKGYWGGGYTGSYSNEIDGIQFSTDTAINPTATLSIARRFLTGVNSTSKGYWGGGLKIGDINETEIDGIQFSTDTAINPTATLSIARYGTAGVNSSLKGYFCGGRAGAASSEIDGIQFSDESAINPAVALSIARQNAAGASSTIKGYVTGGIKTGDIFETEIDGIQFSGESAINPAVALSIARSHNASFQSGSV